MIILDEANAIIRQISSNTNARKSENAICNILRSVRHVLVINPFANTSTLTFLQTYRGENIHTVDNKYQPRIGYDLLKQGKCVAFVITRAVMDRALVKKASKLTKSDNSHIRAPYTNTMEAEISFKVTSYFDIVIAITNITTPVYVKTLTQMLYQIHDSELESTRPNNLPTAIKDHCEWDSNIISYKINKSLTVIIFIEVEQQKCLFARYFIEKLCSLIVSTEMDFNAIATFQNLSPKKAEILKFDQEHFIADTMALKRFYLQNFYDGKDINIDDWNNLCNRKIVKYFSPLEPQKYFLYLSQFQRHGYDEESEIEGLKAENTT
ncbi:12331_t:CDS:2 [Funneliformis geosporum]|uniref:12331_t:CDS:1 n=1 Tax=Funneliformis geosporum TaxID=1117311 RepID=A0A9W4SNH3_9GLOM|nr:12331_t:CDS:2 [Funneliformis geosporum]